MLMSRKFMIPINPEPWTIGPVGITNRGGTKRPFVAPNPQLLNYQQAVKEHLLALAPRPTIVDEECELNFYFWRRLDSYVTASNRGHKRHVADATNLQKGLEDALQGVIITNDRLVVRINSEVIEQGPDVHPGIIIVQKPVEWTLHRQVSRLELNEFTQQRVRSQDIDLGNVI